MNTKQEINIYMDIAESVYLKAIEKYRFTGDLAKNLNWILGEIIKQADEINLKLKYRSIDFEACLNEPSFRRKGAIDISLLPQFSHKDEFILWLTKFISTIVVSKKTYRIAS